SGSIIPMKLAPNLFYIIVGIRYRLTAVIRLPKLVGAIRGANLPELMAEEWQAINAQGRETLGQALGRALFDTRVEGFLSSPKRKRVINERRKRQSRRTGLPTHGSVPAIGKL